MWVALQEVRTGEIDQKYRNMNVFFGTTVYACIDRQSLFPHPLLPEYMLFPQGFLQPVLGSASRWTFQRTATHNLPRILPWTLHPNALFPPPPSPLPSVWFMAGFTWLAHLWQLLRTNVSIWCFPCCSLRSQNNIAHKKPGHTFPEWLTHWTKAGLDMQSREKMAWRGPTEPGRQAVSVNNVPKTGFLGMRHLNKIQVRSRTWVLRARR